MFHEHIDKEQKAVEMAIRHVTIYAGKLACESQAIAKKFHECVMVAPEFKNGDDYLNMIVAELMVDGKLDGADLYHKSVDAVHKTTGLMCESELFGMPKEDDD